MNLGIVISSIVYYLLCGKELVDVVNGVEVLAVQGIRAGTHLL